MAVARHLLNPLATPDQAKRSPSNVDGVDEHTEKNLRAYGALLIQQTGIHLKAPQVVMTTATVLFQRFFYVSSVKNFSVKDIAASALFVSSKLEEWPIRIRDLINCLDYLLKLVEWEKSQMAIEKARSVAASLGGNGSSSTIAKANFKYQPMDYFAKEFYDWKDDIVIGESQILKRLGFNATVQNPYGGIVNYLQVLNLTDHPDIPQRAWSFANDALLTPLLVLYPPHYISVTAIYLACLFASTEVALPMDPAPWWELFDVPSEEAIHEVCKQLLELYTTWTGHLDWLTGSQGGMVGRKTIWRRAAELQLPMTKEDVRHLLSKQ